MDLEDFSYIIYSIPESFGTYYEIYDCDRGFLVYGEIELVLLDKEFHEQSANTASVFIGIMFRAWPVIE